MVPLDFFSSWLPIFLLYCMLSIFHYLYFFLPLSRTFLFPTLPSYGMLPVTLSSCLPLSANDLPFPYPTLRLPPSLALSAAPPYLTILFYLPPLLRSFTKHSLSFPAYVSFCFPFLVFRSSSLPDNLASPHFSSFSLFLFFRFPLLDPARLPPAFSSVPTG